MNLAFSWQNVLDGNGIWVTITGMVIVFFGLIFISVFIASLPHLLSLRDSIQQKKESVGVEEEEEELDEDLLAAISYVVWCEREELESADHQKITMQKGESNSIWAQVGRMRTLRK